jgi:hypothetical protein
MKLHSCSSSKFDEFNLSKLLRSFSVMNSRGTGKIVAYLGVKTKAYRVLVIKPE